MAMNIRKLNGDTTFLISFVAGSAAEHDDAAQFTVLVDPWLQGQSSWLHPSFQFSQHTVSPVVDSLAQIADQTDLIIISQDKPDHCHRQTLCSWPLHKKISIFAAPAAARKIRDWKHFPSDWIHDLPAYNSAVPSTLFKFAITAGSKDIKSAEFTIANLASKKDLTGLHNAIAMTYCSQSQATTKMHRQDSSNDNADDTADRPQLSLLSPARDETGKPGLRSRLKSYRSLRNLNQQHQRQQLATPPQTPDEQACLSCIYTPHGFSTALIEPYTQAHLLPARALPVDVLLHSTVKERNPWYMGGVVVTGTPGGIEIIQSLHGQVKTWITAHDEKKDNRGVSVALLKTRNYDDDEINALLKQSGYDDVKLMCLESGQEVMLAD